MMTHLMPLLELYLNSFHFFQLFSILRIKDEVKDNYWLVKSTVFTNMSHSWYKLFFFMQAITLATSK